MEIIVLFEKFSKILMALQKKMETALEVLTFSGLALATPRFTHLMQGTKLILESSDSSIVRVWPIFVLSVELIYIAAMRPIVIEFGIYNWNKCPYSKFQQSTTWYNLKDFLKEVWLEPTRFFSISMRLQYNNGI